MFYKVIIFLLLLLTLSISTQAQDQGSLSYGLKAGLNRTNQSFFKRDGNQGEKGSYDSRLSPSIGAFAELSSARHISAVAVLGYREKGARADFGLSNGGNGKSVQQLLYLDILLKLRKDFGSASVYLLAGNRGELLIASQRAATFERDYETAAEKELVLSPVVGVGIAFLQSRAHPVFVELEYNPGTANLLKPSFLNRNDIRNNSVGIVAGIKL